jgi:hypothetical protein
MAPPVRSKPCAWSSARAALPVGAVQGEPKDFPRQQFFFGKMPDHSILLPVDIAFVFFGLTIYIMRF